MLTGTVPVSANAFGGVHKDVTAADKELNNELKTYLKGLYDSKGELPQKYLNIVNDGISDGKLWLSEDILDPTQEFRPIRASDIAKRLLNVKYELIV